MGGSIFGGEKRTIGCAPEEVKVIVHLDQVPYLSCTSEAVLWTSEARREAAVCIKKALSGFRYFYSIRILRLGLRAGACRLPAQKFQCSPPGKLCSFWVILRAILFKEPVARVRVNIKFR